MVEIFACALEEVSDRQKNTVQHCSPIVLIGSSRNMMIRAFDFFANDINVVTATIVITLWGQSPFCHAAYCGIASRRLIQMLTVLFSVPQRRGSGLWYA